MLDGFKIVSVTPAGRQRFVKLLAHYLLQEQGLIDQHEWWVNTDVPEDVAFLEELERQHPAFFKVVTMPRPVPPPDKRSYRICEWAPRLVESDTIYLRLDDDIVYIAPGAIRALLQFRIENPAPFLVYPCIVNNSVISHLLQRFGAVPWDQGNCNYDCFGRGWKDGPFAELVHRSFLDALRKNDMGKWQFDEWHLNFYERVSINCIAWFGRDFAGFGGQVAADEEQFLSCTKPAQLRRPNAIYGRSLVAHFSYFTQIAHLDKTNLLDQYSQVQKLPAGLIKK